jgi:hypothetical protein
MAFDAQAYRAAYQPPTYRAADGTVHTGKLLSRFEYLAIKDDITALDQGTPEEQEAHARKVLEAFLPHSNGVVTEILHLPAELFDEVLGDFFGCQKRPLPPSASAVPATPAPSSTAS